MFYYLEKVRKQLKGIKKCPFCLCEYYKKDESWLKGEDTAKRIFLFNGESRIIIKQQQYFCCSSCKEKYNGKYPYRSSKNID